MNPGEPPLPSRVVFETQTDWVAWLAIPVVYCFSAGKSWAQDWLRLSLSNVEGWWNICWLQGSVLWARKGFAGPRCLCSSIKWSHLNLQDKTRTKALMWFWVSPFPPLAFHNLLSEPASSRSLSLLLKWMKKPTIFILYYIKAREMRLRVKSLRGALQRVPNNEQTVPASPKNPWLNSSMTERAPIPKGHRFLNMMSLRCG